MKDDPIVAEVRKARAQIMKEFDYNLDKYVAHLRQKTAEAKAAGQTVVSRQPKRAVRNAAKKQKPRDAA